MLGSTLLNDAFPAMVLKMLADLMHKGPYGSFPARLKAPVIGRIQIGNSHSVQSRLYNGRGGHARHAGEGKHIDNTVVAFFNKLHDGRDAQTGFGGDIKGKNVFFREQLFQMADLMIVFKINEPGGAVIKLLLSDFLVEKIAAEADDLLQMLF